MEICPYSLKYNIFQADQMVNAHISVQVPTTWSHTLHDRDPITTVSWKLGKKGAHLQTNASKAIVVPSSTHARPTIRW
jgi:hypothetical protein